MSLDKFPIERLCGPGADAAEEARTHVEFVNALAASVSARGIEQTIDLLNAQGHGFLPVQPGSGSEGWQIFRERGADGERDLQISIETETGDILLTTPTSDDAWERILADRKAGLTPAERERESLRDAFYARGGKLFAEQYDNPGTLGAKDDLLMVVYTLDAEIGNGGFAQYFDNTGGRDAERALRALGDIGAPVAQGLLRRAMDLVGGPFGDALDARQREALEVCEAELGGLDDAWYALDEDVALLAMAWPDGD